MRVLVIDGHPGADSLCGALAAAYADGARGAGTEVDVLRLRDLSFDPDYPHGREDEAEEPDIVDARARVTRADHVVFVFPNWWGTMPALLKGFIDRILRPGYAFRLHSDGTWDRLLAGRSAQLIITMDTPRWVYRWIYASPGVRALKQATLQFCGFNPVRVLTFGTVFDSSPERRARWIEEARAAGLRLAHGVPDRRERLQAKAASWIRAMRLQFYPMTWIAYAVGAMSAAGGQAILSTSLFWLGYAAVFLLEFATVLLNEYFDYRSDRSNRNFGPFNGGSRVLVDGSLSFREVRSGIGLTVLGFLAVSFALVGSPGTPSAWVGLVLCAALVLCLGYTTPPLKLSHRGFGEIDVAVTHSFLVLLFGYLLHGGDARDAFPWIAGVPLCLSILPAIALSGLPDREADEAAGKRTLAVKRGPSRVVDFAIVATAAAAVTATLWDIGGFAQGLYAGVAWFVIPHAAILIHRLAHHRHRATAGGRINGLMVVALTYTLWFTVIPLINAA